MALTLADFAKMERQPLKKMVMTNLLRYSDLLGLVPFDNVGTLTSQVVRWKTLPSVAFRQINGTYTEGTGSTETVTEGVYALGGEVKFDRVFDMVDNAIEDPKKTQINMKLKAVAFKFNDAFINGDHVSDVNSFEGLQKRIASYLPARQSISMAALSSDVTATTALQNEFIDKLHLLVDSAGLRTGGVRLGETPNGTRGAILCNRDTYLGMGKVLRRLGLLDTTTDAFGREYPSFAGVPIIDVGLKSDGSTEIIANTYGASGDETRILCVRFGNDDGLTGIQLNTPDAYDPIEAGEGSANTTGPQKLLRIDWWVGLAAYGSFYASRLTGVQDPSTWTG